MYWPVRMCHPVSPSPNNDIQPLSPQATRQTISAIKKRSESDGVKRRAMPRPALALNVPPRDETGAGPSDSGRDCGGECVEVANGGRYVGTPCPGKVIDLEADLL